jgi:mono/diheme cytochrome c family protein
MSSKRLQALAAACLLLAVAAASTLTQTATRAQATDSAEQAARDDENAESIKRGLELSQLLCMRCHAISGPGPGPNEKSPPFNTLVEKLSIEGVADQLLEGLPLGHEPMPKWEFSEQQAEDLLLYIEYIGRKKQLQ